MSFTIFRGGEDSALASLLKFEVLSKSIEGDLCHFALKFESPELVSLAQTPDVLVVSIVNDSLLSSSESGVGVDPNFMIQKILPRMLPGEEFAETLETAGATVEKGF